MIQIGAHRLSSRLFLGTARYPTQALLVDAIAASEPAVVTVSLKRENASRNSDMGPFWRAIQASNALLLPNTAGCHRAQDAIEMAEIARDLFETNWIKVEVIGDDYTLQPDSFALLEACEVLIKRGFTVFPYCIDDLVVCQRLVDVGCSILMPWAAPIGSGQGIIHPEALQLLRARFPEQLLVVDAGLGRPSHAAQAMEMGVDAVLLNSAVALADDPVQMAKAFQWAVASGRLAYEAGMMPVRTMASASTALIDTPFWTQGT